MAAFAAVTEPGPARPDVHLHGLPQPGLPGEGRRDRRRHLRRPGRDGHRRRLVRARVARLRLRLPDAPASGSAMLDEGVADHARRPVDRRASRRSHGKHYQVDGAICRRGRCRARRAGQRQRHPAVDRRRRREEDAADRRRSTPTTPTSTARPEGFTHKCEILRGHCDDVGRDFDAIVRVGQLQRRHRPRPRPRSQDRLGWIRDHYLKAGLSEPRSSSRTVQGLRERPAGRHARADRREAQRPAGRWA